jgi:hypothetical protein
MNFWRKKQVSVFLQIKYLKFLYNRYPVTSKPVGQKNKNFFIYSYEFPVGCKKPSPDILYRFSQNACNFSEPRQKPQKVNKGARAQLS